MKIGRDSGLATDPGESTSPARTQVRALVASVAIIFALVLIVSGLKPKPSEAMPPFSRALGVDCSLCHSSVPELNAYGRYIQRTMYSGLSYNVQKRVSPFWFYYIAQLNSTRGADQYNKTATIGPLYNLAIDATGFAGPQFTYRVEQQLYSKQASGGSLGPAWMAYDGFFNGNGHLAAGYIRSPGPMFQVNPIDFACGFASRHFAVGSHVYDLTNTRWGTEFNYERGWLDAEIGWFAGEGSTLNFNQFAISPGSDHEIKYKLAYSPSSGPWEIGTYGALHGSFILSGALAATQQIDSYDEFSEYVQRDPTPTKGGISVPGLFAYHEAYHDSNPGIIGAGSPAGFPGYYVAGTSSSAWAFELYEPIGRGNRYWVTARPETDNNGLGTDNHYFTIGFNSAPIVKMPMLHFGMDLNMGKYSTSYTNKNGTSTSMQGRPTWEFALQYYGSFEGPMTHIGPPPAQTPRVAAAPAAPNGAQVYAQNCAACHQASGTGVAPNFPALTGNAVVTASDPAGVIGIIKHGAGGMPAFTSLSNADVAAVATYIRSSWGNNASAVTEADAAAVK